MSQAGLEFTMYPGLTLNFPLASASWDYRDKRAPCSSASYNIEHLYFNLLSLMTLSPQVLGVISGFFSDKVLDMHQWELGATGKMWAQTTQKNEEGNVRLKSIRP